jgi:hypothetical protein
MHFPTEIFVSKMVYWRAATFRPFTKTVHIFRARDQDHTTPTRYVV